MLGTARGEMRPQEDPRNISKFFVHPLAALTDVHVTRVELDYGATGHQQTARLHRFDRAPLLSHEVGLLVSRQLLLGVTVV